MSQNRSDHNGEQQEAKSAQNGGDPTRRDIIATPAFLYATVLAMGAIGALLRYVLELAIPTEGFPVATLLINLIGCYIIYIIYQWFDRRVRIPHAIARGIGVGLVGAFTTLSAFCTESLGLLQTGEYLLFAAYLAATVFGTFLASIAGWATCALLAFQRLKRLQRRRIEHRLAMQRAKQEALARADGSTPSVREQADDRGRL